MEVLHVDKPNCICCFTQRHTYGCKNAVSPEPLLGNRTINCLTFDESTRKPYYDKLCLFRALAFHLHGTQRLEEETSKLFNLIINKMDGLSADQFQGVHKNNIPIVEDLITLNILHLI